MNSAYAAYESRFDFVGSKLASIKASGLYRQMPIGSVSGPYIRMGSKSMINLGSNDYLAIRSQDESISQMQSSSRLIAGNDEIYQKTEKRLSELKSMEASLIYPTGYMANLGILPVLAGRGDLVLSDSLNHASIIQSIKITGAQRSIYGHNDMDDLERKLQTDARRMVIVTEGIFSMNGDAARLTEISRLAKEYGAILVLDDAHGDFVAGGGGTPEQQNVDVDVLTSSLSKALGSFGGYVSSRSDVIDLCINSSKSFVYTSALPSAVVRHTMARLDMDLEPYRRRLRHNIDLFSAGLMDIGLASEPQSHIIPIMTGSAGVAVRMAKQLQEMGVFVVPIRYPTVPHGMERLRLSISGWLDQDQIATSLDALRTVAIQHKLI